MKPALAGTGNDWPPQIPEEAVRRRFPPLELRVMLLNADRQIIFGRQDGLQQINLSPIRHQAEIVGYLGLLPGKTVNHVSETRFLERQLESFIWIALLMIALSAGLAVLLAYLLGRPLKRITTAAKALAVGQYDWIFQTAPLELPKTNYPNFLTGFTVRTVPISAIPAAPAWAWPSAAISSKPMTGRSAP